MSDTPDQDPSGDGGLSWEIDVPLVTHPLMLAQFAKLFGISGAVMGGLLSLLMAVTGEFRSIVPMLLMTGAVMGVIAVLSLVASLLVLGNRMRMRFTLDARGTRSEVIDRRSKAVNTAAIVLGAVTGKPGLAGAGLLAQANRSQSAAWDGVVKARFNKGWRTVSLSNSWRTVLILFCTPQTYDAVCARVTAGLAGRRRPARKSPLPGLLLRTALTIGACAPLFHLPDVDEAGLFPALFTLCFAVAALWLIPLLAWAVVGGLAWLTWLEAVAATRSHTSMFGGGSFRGFEVFSGDDWAVLVIAALGAAWLLWMSAGLLTGRLQSGLAGDLADLDSD